MRTHSECNGGNRLGPGKAGFLAETLLAVDHVHLKMLAVACVSHFPHRFQLLQVPFPESMAVIGPLVKQLEDPLQLDHAATWAGLIVSLGRWRTGQGRRKGQYYSASLPKMKTGVYRRKKEKKGQSIGTILCNSKKKKKKETEKEKKKKMTMTMTMNMKMKMNNNMNHNLTRFRRI